MSKKLMPCSSARSMIANAVGLARERSEVHRAEAERAHSQRGAAETSILHVVLRAWSSCASASDRDRRYPRTATDTTAWLRRSGLRRQASEVKRLAAIVSCIVVFGACSSSSKPSAKPAAEQSSPTSTAATTTTVATGPRSIGHVFVINLENENYATTWGASSPAQYLNGTLVKQGKLLTQYYGIGHASLDNYIAEISGQAPNPTTQGDCLNYIEFVVDRHRRVRPGARRGLRVPEVGARRSPISSRPRARRGAATGGHGHAVPAPGHRCERHDHRAEAGRHVRDAAQPVRVLPFDHRLARLCAERRRLHAPRDRSEVGGDDPEPRLHHAERLQRRPRRTVRRQASRAASSRPIASSRRRCRRSWRRPRTRPTACS